MKKPKTYAQYKDEEKSRNDSIMAKYGAPEGAKPPLERSFIPTSSDRGYRQYAFLNRIRLEAWKPAEQRIPGRRSK